VTPRSLIFDVAVKGLYPLMLLASFWILLRGHDEPGGGFIAGMVAVAATAMLAVARGSKAALEHMPLGPMRLAAVSALLSLVSGLPALLFGDAYMTHVWHTLELGITDYDLSTVLFFDIGVYGAVWAGLGSICAQAIGIDEGGT
jgi:multicomponent Na+:H+ antiporter subunit B